MDPKSFPEVRSFSSSKKMNSGAFQQAEPSGSSGHPNFASEMPFRECTSAKPLGPRLAKDLREHKSNEKTFPIPLLDHQWHRADPWHRYRKSPMYRGVVETLKEEAGALQDSLALAV